MVPQVVQILLWGQSEIKVHGPASSWTTTQFKPFSVPSSFFPILHKQVVSNLSAGQFYAYNICWALIHGKVDDDWAYLQVGPTHPLFIRDGSL